MKALNFQTLILQRIVPHYRIAFLEKLVEKDQSVGVLYGQKTKKGLIDNAQMPENGHFLKIKNHYLYRDKVFFSGYWKWLRRIRPKAVVTVFNIGNLNVYWLLLLRSVLGLKVILWSFGYDPFKGFLPQKRFADKIRLCLYEKADAVVFYWERGREIVAEHARKTDHFFVAPNTINTDLMFSLRQSFEQRGEQAIRDELGLGDEIHFVYTGRLLKEKEVGHAIRAFAVLQKKAVENISFSIIGKGPDLERLQNLVAELNVKNVHFRGQIIEPEKVGKWLYVSAAMLMPGRLGNAVVHAFCFGLPVISQDKDTFFHGEGIGYMAHGYNGFLAKNGDVNDYVSQMQNAVLDYKQDKKLGKQSIKTVVEKCSLTKMAEGMLEAIAYAKR